MTRRAGYLLAFGLALLVLAGIAAYELIASPFQAMLLADYAKRLTYQSAPGPSERIRFPESGPYDIRLGYVGLPGFRKRLEARGFMVSQQARLSPEMDKLAAYSLFLPYREKTSAGLSLNDCSGAPYYSFSVPRRTYADFAAVPPVVANTLLFIENRELLDPNHPRRNPAVEWDRLAQAVLEKAVKIVQPGRNVPGGSTLATQIEKYRHSPDGLTMTAGDKLRQMASASVRAYLDGTDTRVTRRRIVLDYLNTVPLAAAPGFGEVHGIGDGLSAWFGIDFDQANALLKQSSPTPESAHAYKHVLGLLISQRKPSWYLTKGRKELDTLADVHLGLLADAGVITPAFRDLARAQSIEFATTKNATRKVIDKAATTARTELSAMLGVPRLYDLDRLDLSVATTLHAPTQAAVAGFLHTLGDPAAVGAAGLLGKNLLSTGNDLGKVLYSFTLYELSDDGAALRVQADSLDQPFDLNQGAKLDMGSSAKLRTLITYLQLMAELHAKYRNLSAEQLDQLDIPPQDALTHWAVAWLRQSPDRSLNAMLRGAMGRRYSANPGEAFYTGGGLHTFANFNKQDNHRAMDLWEATRNSVNLPFIRLMRDLVRHFVYRSPGTNAKLLADPDDPRRKQYLTRFADKEGRVYLSRFWKKYRALNPQQIADALLANKAAYPVRMAAAYRYMEPGADFDHFSAAMKARLANPALASDTELARLYVDYGKERFNLADRAYITQTHPLELWLAAYLRTHPGATWNAVVEASKDERIAGYEWLFKSSRKTAQDIRIQSLLEVEAFSEIHKRWKALGYPFASLVPSYATAIGSSADRPAALAELMGVILNDGIKPIPATIRRLDFAAGTPYHTVFVHTAPAPERIFPIEVASTIRQALVNVVHEGTARRAEGAFTAQGRKLLMGGKTGTGDHRLETYARNGAVVESKVVNRVATFAFFAGDRHYGVITAFVPGEEAAHYKFTSALPVQLLKAMAPILQPLIASGEGQPKSWPKAAAEFEAENAPPARPVAQPVLRAGNPTEAESKPELDPVLTLPADAAIAPPAPAVPVVPAVPHAPASPPARETPALPPATSPVPAAPIRQTPDPAHEPEQGHRLI